MRCKDCPFFVQGHWTEGGFDEAECKIFGSVDSPEISENSKGVPGCRYNSKFLEAARRGEQLAHERYLADSNPARKVLCTFINKNSRALTPVLISQYKSLHELLRASLRGHVDTQGGLFRAVEIDTEKVPESVERWLRGVDAPKPEGAFDITEQVEYTLVHPNGDSGTTYVYKKS